MPQDDPRTEKELTRQQRGGSSRSEQTRGGTTAAAEEMATRVGDLGTSTLNAGLRMQTEMFDTLRTIGREWMERKTSEAEFALNLPNRLAGVHSIPEAVSTYQEWLSEWLTLCNEDGRRLLADGQRIMVTSARCFTNISPGATTR